MFEQGVHQSFENPTVAMCFFNGKQADLAEIFMRRQIAVEPFQFTVERERSLTSHCHHANQIVVMQSNNVSVLTVKPVDQSPFNVRRMLRDLFDESPVIEFMDGLNFRHRACGLENISGHEKLLSPG
jgi:hypothetical protein